jgi:hypothetical protein
MALPTSLAHRFRMAAAHFGASAVVAAVAALLIFKVWYPSPFANIAGGLSLFALLVGVDVVLGPALTAVAASPGKPRRVFLRDLAVIVSLQLAAFGYGAYTVALARPVALVFEVDLMRLVSAAEIQPGEVSAVPAPSPQLSWSGPRLMAAALPAEGDEMLRAIDLGLAGIHLAMQPVYWRDYSSQSSLAWKAARPVSKLLGKYPESAAEVAQLARSAGVPFESLRFLPLTARHADGVTLIAPPDAQVIGHLPLDGFF